MENPQDKAAAPGMQEQMPGDVLEALAREGARQLLAQALENEVAEFIENHRDLTDSKGRRSVVRNGYLPERELVTGIGALKIRQPRVDDRELDGARQHRFNSDCRLLTRWRRPCVPGTSERACRRYGSSC